MPELFKMPDNLELDKNTGNEGTDPLEPTAEELAAQAQAAEAAKNLGNNNPLLEKINKTLENKDNSNQSDNDENKDLGAVGLLVKEYGLDTDDFKDALKDLDLKSSDLEDIKKIYSVRDEIVKKQAIEELDPVVKDLYNHLAEGKRLESWQKQQEMVDWSKVEIKPEEIEKQEQLVSQYLKSKGLSDKIIKSTIDNLKDDDELHAESLNVLKDLDARDKAELQRIQAAEIAQTAADKLESQKVITDISNIVKSGKLQLSKDITFDIPETERKQFLNDVLTDRNVYYDGLDYHQQLFLDMVAKKVKEGKISDIKFGTNGKTTQRTVTVRSSNPLKDVSEGTGTGKELSDTDFRNLVNKI